MAVPYLSLTEEWIREKVQLQHKCLADVRSLCLPGTYEGKIGHLGSSLKNFVRLKLLDLSYNALVSLEGIQHLKMLEILSLYYNRISSLSEVRSLCKLKALREIDLRLNPVAKNSPDYRLFLVHELPDLRKIDDCPVRDRERKASILHFSSDVTFEPCQATPFPSGERNDQSRVALMRQITKKRSFLDDSDEAVLNLVAKSNLHLGEPSSLPVSTNKELKCQLYNLQDDHEEDNDKDSAESFQPSKQDPAKPILGHNCRREKHGVQPSRVTSSSEGDRVVGTGLRVGVSFAESLQKSYSKASEEEGQHGVQIQPRIPAQWNFTPKPEDAPLPSSHSLSTKTQASNVHSPKSEGAFTSLSRSPRPTCSRSNDRHRLERFLPPAEENSKQRETTLSHSSGKHLAVLLELVDKHWDGKGSLRSNHKFLSQAVQILSKMEQATAGPQQDVTRTTENIQILNEQRRREEKEYRSEIQNLHRHLEEARSSIEELNRQLTDTLEENLSLQKQLIKSEQRWLSWQMNGSPEVIGNQSTNEHLKREAEELKETIQQAGKVQELADMLQESHRSLVFTNERLLSELAETKARHREELEQLRKAATSASAALHRKT